uniref:Uncharacterized protein n=1 Tax=Peromyscus maniculatus bairdii TaxID=230844 RepID=A0A8C8W3N5_PERMB
MKKSTIIRICEVPVLGGEPPSSAVRVNLNSACSSRSNPFSTSSGYFLPLPPSFNLRWRKGFPGESVF